MNAIKNRSIGTKCATRHSSKATRAAIEPLETRVLLTTVVVNTIIDGTFPLPTISLRNAINTANASATPTTITFDPKVFAAPQTIVLNGNQLELSNTKESTTITGPAKGVTINANNASRVFQIDAGVTASFSGVGLINGRAINGATDITGSGGDILNYGTLTMSNGVVSGGSANNFGGGGISNEGTMIVRNATISGCSSQGGAGGVVNRDNMTLTDVTFSTNSCNDVLNEYGGGGILSNGGLLSMTDATFSGNKSSVEGGAIWMAGPATLTNITVSGNTATTTGGGIFVYSGMTTISNSLVAGNHSTSDSSADVSGSFNSRGFNLVAVTDGSTGFNAFDLTGTAAKPLNAKLGMLANNGGLTRTLLPLAGSPAIDHGENANVPTGITTDQRGLPRIVHGTVDIGAVEVQGKITVAAPAAQTALTGQGKSFALGSFTETNAIGPFDVDVNWGDGTADSKLSVNAAGTIPATAHTFASVGSKTVTVSVTNPARDPSNKVTFAVTVAAAPGSISGQIFDDANSDGKHQPTELGLGLWTVYIDSNNDGKLDGSEVKVVTDINGNWSFKGLVADTYVVRVVPVAGTTATKPTGGVLTIKLAVGQQSAGNLFGEIGIV